MSSKNAGSGGGSGSTSISSGYETMSDEELWNFSSTFDRNYTYVHADDGDYYLFRSSVGTDEFSSYDESGNAITPENSPEEFERLDKIRNDLIRENVRRGYWEPEMMEEDIDMYSAHSTMFLPIIESQNETTRRYEYNWMGREDYLKELYSK